MNLRQQQIYQLIQQQGFVSVDFLADKFTVTPQTIRRDITALSEGGMVKRYHGGAGQASTVENIDYKQRQILHHQDKLDIARLVAAELPDNASLFMNLGTTTEAVATEIVNHRGLRVITNNLNVATTLSANPTAEVIIAGGVVRPKDQGIVGENTIDFVRQFKVDYGIIGISGIENDGTLLDYDYREVRVAQEIIAQSRKVWLVVDHSKFERSALVRLGHLSSVHALFTDKQPPPEIQEIIDEFNIHLFVVDKK